MSGLADRTGLEPATSAVTGQHSNQLNYRSLFYSQKTGHPQCAPSDQSHPQFGSAKIIAEVLRAKCFFVRISNLLPL